MRSNVQKQIDGLDHIGSPVQLICESFITDISLVYDGIYGNECCKFNDCYKGKVNHCRGYDKAWTHKDLESGRSSCWLQDGEVGKIEEEGLLVPLPPGHRRQSRICKSLIALTNISQYKNIGG